MGRPFTWGCGVSRGYLGMRHGGSAGICELGFVCAGGGWECTSWVRCIGRIEMDWGGCDGRARGRRGGMRWVLLGAAVKSLGAAVKGVCPQYTGTVDKPLSRAPLHPRVYPGNGEGRVSFLSTVEELNSAMGRTEYGSIPPCTLDLSINPLIRSPSMQGKWCAIQRLVHTEPVSQPSAPCDQHLPA